MDRLVSAYLAYWSHDSGDYLPHASDREESDTPPFLPFTIESLDTYCNYFFSCFLDSINFSYKARSLMNFCPIQGKVWPNETLIWYGYIGCAPVQPTLAFSIRALELYHQTHRTCPQFSLEAQCKTMCYMHRVSSHLTIFHTFLKLLRFLIIQDWKFSSPLHTMPTSKSVGGSTG